MVCSLSFHDPQERDATMKSTQGTTVHMRIKFSDRNLAHPVLDSLGRHRVLMVNILRGRITQTDASFELAVTGTPRNVENLVRLSTTWGASVGALVVDVA